MTVGVVTNGAYGGRGKLAAGERLGRPGLPRRRSRSHPARAPGAPWSPQDPHLYPLEVALTEGRRATDSYPLEIGIRTVEVHGDQLLLNGSPCS